MHPSGGKSFSGEEQSHVVEKDAYEAPPDRNETDPVLAVSATGRMIKRLLIVLSLLVLPHLVVAQETSSWIGQKVVTKYGYSIKIGDRVVEKQNFFHVYTVQRANGDRLLVVSDSVEGWIPASQVVRFDQAIDFYTQEIKANPGNSRAWRLSRAHLE